MAAGLVASLLALTGCALPVSGASMASSTTSTTTTSTSLVATPAPSTTTSSSTSSSTTAAPAPAMKAAAAPPSPLVSALRATWSKTPHGSCLMVTDGSKVVFERNPDLGVVPASTMKLLTATAVLARIDPDTRLATPVLAAAPPDASGTVTGDLWLVGGGDPVLGTLPYRASFRRQPRLVTAIEVLADRLVASGVRRVTGRVVGDDGRYERLRYLPSWPARYIAADETGPLSALSVNDGFARWRPGTVPFTDPAAGAASVLNELLRQRGVHVQGAPASGSFPKGAVELASIPSPTMFELVRQMLLDSDNSTAELLLRELGLRVAGQGTTGAGRKVVVDTLTAMGLPMRGVRVVDASGLDRGNRVTCRLLVALLTQAPTSELAARGLPVAAQTGTLYRRFLATPVAGHVRAKTGTIRAVSGLAGHADGAGGRPLTFAYVQNNVGRGQGTPLQNELGHHLVLTPSQ